MAHKEIFAAYDRTKLATIPYESYEQVEKKLCRAFAAYQNQDQWLPTYERLAILEAFIELVSRRQEELVMTAAKEGGKPYQDSVTEIERGIEGVKVAISELRQLAGQEIPMGLSKRTSQRLAFTTPEPRGVVIGVSAFNHPFNLIIHQVIPAVAVGCPVLIKPASDTPLSCQAIVEMLHQAGLPDDYCQMFFCENEVASEIVQDPRVSFLTFIGSAKVGWKLRSTLPPGATCTLEHGGVAPVIFDKSADIESAVPDLVKAGYYHAGQVCVSVQRVYVHTSVADQFCETFVKQVKQLKVGDPTDAQTEVGPLIRPKEVERVSAWVDEAVKHGAKLLCGGERISETCYQPTVLRNPPDDVEVSKEEVFGPVVCVYTYEDRNEAIRRANSLNVAFQASVFSKDIEIALDTAKRLKGLAVMINDHTAFRADWMPFGGYKESGLGVGGIGYTMREMCIQKLLVFKSPGI